MNTWSPRSATSVLEIRMLTRRFAIALATAGIGMLMSSSTVFAAMDATLSSDHARAGDWVLLLTDDHGGRGTYEGLSAEGSQPIYLAPTAGEASVGCGGARSKTVGQLEWRGNRGGVAFQVPSLQAGTYYIFMKTNNQCWRIGGRVGGGHAPLVLGIGNNAAQNQDIAASWRVDSLTSPSPPTSEQPRQQTNTSEPVAPRLLIIAATLMATLLIGVAARWQWRRHPRQ